jgi:hypothetical protein
MTIVEEVYIVSCIPLAQLYEKYVEPYLNLYGNFINKQEAIMAEVYYFLEKKQYGSLIPISSIPLRDYIVTDIVNYFYHRFNNMLESLLFEIEILVKDKMLVEIKLGGCYDLLLKVVSYK